MKKYIPFFLLFLLFTAADAQEPGKLLADSLLNQLSKATGKKEKAACYDRIAKTYNDQGNYTAAMSNYLQALKLYEELADNVPLGYCYNSIGSIYKGQHNYPDALKNHLLALKIFRAINDKHGIGSTYNALGDVAENQGNYTTALDNYQAALATLTGQGNRQWLIWPYFNIGEVYLLQGNYPAALTYLDSALRLQQEFGDSSGIAWTYNNIGAAYLYQGKLAEAGQYCSKAYTISIGQHDISGMRNATRNLAKLYEAQGNYRKALENHKTYTLLQDSLFSDQNTRSLLRLQMQYDFDKKEELSKVKQSKKDLVLAGIVVLSLLIAIGVIVAYRSQRKANKLRELLLKQQQESIAQKEMLMKEIHHRVKNNLQVISSLLDLQLGNIADTSSAIAIRESITRINAISLIHQQLYRHDHFAAIEFAQFTTDLYVQLNTLFANTGQQITLKNSIPALSLDIDTAVPLGLLLNELITNSYKHAFNTADGYISIGMKKQDGAYTLLYTDSGPGMPQGFSPKDSKTLGATIIHSLSRQIGGSVNYIFGNNEFIITFRDSADMKKDA